MRKEGAKHGLDHIRLFGNLYDLRLKQISTENSRLKFISDACTLEKNIYGEI